MFTGGKGNFKIDAASIAATFLAFGSSIPQICFPLFLFEQWEKGRREAKDPTKWKLS